MGLLTGTKAQKPSAAAAAPAAAKPRPRPTRVDFVASVEAKELLDEKGRLKGSPLGRFDDKRHLLPSKNDFASESIYLGWRADQLEERATDMAKQATELRSEAERCKNAPNPEVRAVQKKLQRLKDMQAQLEEQLKKEGINF